MSPSAIELRLELPLAHFVLRVECTSSTRTLGVFGPSGSGKTSLLEAIAGWRPGTRGFLRVEERVLLDSERGIALPVRARGIGYVPQDALLFPHLDVERNLRAHARPHEVQAPQEDVFARAVDVLGLGRLLERDVATLSGGERQRVALARALCSRPRLLLLDEPLGALDLPLRRKILPWLLRLREAFDVPMVFVSHDATEVQALCDEVLVLDEGRVESRGPTARTLRTRQRPGERFENLLRGRVVAVDAGSAQVELAPGIRVRIAATGLQPGADVRVLIDADDVLVALEPPAGLSARNVLRAQLASLRSVAGSVHAELALHGAPQAEPLLASLTEEAARELGLQAGLELCAVFKSSSCRVLAAGAAAGP